jgi:hypothetical protein
VHLSSRTRDRVILTVLFGGAAILVVIALVLWRHGRDADADERTGAQLDEPTAGLLGQPPQTVPSKAEQKALEESLRSSLTVSDGTGAKHRVTVKASSGGHVYLGYLYRDGKGAGVFVTDRPFEVTRVVRGETKAAVIAVQVLDSPTATCWIYIDGKLAVTKTAHGQGNKVACVA